MPLQVITANRLTDGAAVYLTPSGGWSTRVADAHAASDPETLGAIKARGDAAVADRLVVGVYAIPLAADPAAGPARLRERIRATGPTVTPPGYRAPADAAQLGPAAPGVRPDATV